MILIRINWVELNQQVSIGTACDRLWAWLVHRPKYHSGEADCMAFVYNIDHLNCMNLLDLLKQLKRKLQGHHTVFEVRHLHSDFHQPCCFCFWEMKEGLKVHDNWLFRLLHVIVFIPFQVMGSLSFNVVGTLCQTHVILANSPNNTDWLFISLLSVFGTNRPTTAK